ncbi:MAG: diacylglycerol kinase family lipid kinase [Saprospirales bacterium]|nr:diacylglycerol kinase family lipid kinase [Saprospirales bacterium]MBK8923137.1 diacylglycerol kinase family lipid kinase [Saprospirales bacterium]
MNQSHPVIQNDVLEGFLGPRRIVFIVNPKAGVNLQKHIRESVEHHLDHRKFIYGIWHTEKAGHAAELARKAREEGYDIVVAVGGDGSINEVASVLLHTETILGMIPAGSGNGLAMHLGYGRDIDKAMRKLNMATVQTIDCGQLNGHPFINLAGIGFDGLVAKSMKGSNWRGFLPYFLHSIKAGLVFSPHPCTIETEDRTIVEKCFVVTVANGPMYGYNFKIAPDARLDDGLFSVVIFKTVPRWRYFAAIPSSLQGKIYEAGFVEHFTARQVRIRCEGANFVHVDGESIEMAGDLEFKMIPQALKVLVPRT